jgi:Mor family transcriptional regulator
MENRQLTQGHRKPRVILSADTKAAILADWETGNFTRELLAVKYGCSNSAVRDVIKGRWLPPATSEKGAA